MGPERVISHNPENFAGKNTGNLRPAEASKTIEFPKSPDDKFKAVLNIINNENKSFTIGFLLDNKFRTKDNIKKIAKRYLLPSVKVADATSFQEYCKQTFIPVGAVAEEKIIVKGRTNPVPHYRLTPEGEKYAPIARFALKTAVENGISMHEIFGSTISKVDTKAPHTRAKILLELQKQGNLSNAELADKLGLSLHIVRNNLKALKEKGFLNYVSISPEKSGWSRYEWITEKNPEDVVAINRFSSLTREVAHKMQQIQTSDRNELAIIFNKHKSQTSEILADLERQGFVRHIGRKSNATITEKGRSLTFINTIFESLKKDDLSEINREIEIFNDNVVSSRYITKALSLYEDISPYSKKISKEDNKYTILSLLKNQSLRPEQITKILGKNPQHYLKELLDSGEIIKEREGRAVYYSLNPNPKK